MGGRYCSGDVYYGQADICTSCLNRQRGRTRYFSAMFVLLIQYIQYIQYNTIQYYMYVLITLRTWRRISSIYLQTYFPLKSLCSCRIIIIIIIIVHLLGCTCALRGGMVSAAHLLIQVHILFHKSGVQNAGEIQKNKIPGD